MAYRHVKAVLRHRRRWDAMVGTGNKTSTMGAMLSLLVHPTDYYRGGFIRTLVTERNDFVEPYIPTGLLAVWQPKAAVADQPRLWKSSPGRPAFSDRDAYLWLSLAPGQTIDDILMVSQLRDLEADGYRMEDIINLARRSAGRETQEAGFLEGEVDRPTEGAPNPLIEMLPSLVGIEMMVLGPILLMAARG